MASKRPSQFLLHEHESRPHKRLVGGNNSYTHADPATNAPTSVPTHADYTIAWICALHLELTASLAMLDEVHTSLPAYHGDHNAYVLGRIASHNVVMVALPGIYGKGNAAAVSANLKRSFPNLRATLMVGIGGGAPGEAGLHLGDVVVGMRVMEYDLGKAIGDGEFETTAIPKLPSSMLLSSVTSLRSKHGLDNWSPRSQELLRTRLPHHHRPTQPDHLFQASYPHLGEANTCDSCDVTKLQPRRRRVTENFWIHYGVIASGDSVIKDPHKRDKISRGLEAKCFEMEAAGIMDSLQCLPIRGICDYSDSHKNKSWQNYAAATAASYARELLETIAPVTAAHKIPFVPDKAIPANSSLNPDDDLHIRRKYFLRSIDFPQINSRKDAIGAEQGKTCRWFLTHPKYRAWVDLSNQEPGCSSLLWIRGKAGAGKSTLMKFLYNLVRKNQDGATVVAFFFNARGSYLEKSVAGMYRSLLKQTLVNLPNLQYITDDILPTTPEAECPSLNALKDLLRCAIMALDRRGLIFFIDALDECNEDDVRDMVQFLEDLTESATEENIQFRVCFSSRPYPYIQVEEKLLLTLENETGHSEDLEKYVRKYLNVPKRSQAEFQREVLRKASGVFMWVVLVVKILNKEASKGGHALRQRLSEIPPTLSQLFKDILTRDQERPKELRLCVLWVLCADRPLTPGELCHAMWACGLEDGEVDDEMPDAEDQEANMALVTSSSKGLIEVANEKSITGSTRDLVDEARVQFIHESVRDFLIKERGLQEIWPDVGFDWEGPAHESLRSYCESYLMHPTVRSIIERDQDTSPSRGCWMLLARKERTCEFLEYASESILFHANEANSFIPQNEFLSRFFRLLPVSVIDRFRHSRIRYGPTATLLYILADKGLSNLIRTRSEVDYLSSLENDEALRFQRPLFAAIAGGHEDTIAALLGLTSTAYERGNLIQPSDHIPLELWYENRTPMSWAAQEGQLKLVEVLTQNHESLFQEDFDGYTPLQRAAEGGHEAIVDFILDASVGVTGDMVAEAIFYALHQNHLGRVNALMRRFDTWKTATFSKNDASYGMYLAAKHGFQDLVQLFFQSGAPFQTEHGEVLSVAAANGHLDVVKFLVDNGASIDSGAIKFAARNGNLSIVEFLSEKGASIDSISMVDAAKDGHFDILKFLTASQGIAPRRR